MGACSGLKKSRSLLGGVCWLALGHRPAGCWWGNWGLPCRWLRCCLRLRACGRQLRGGLSRKVLHRLCCGLLGQPLLPCCPLPLLVLLQQALQRGVRPRRQRHRPDGLRREQRRAAPSGAAGWGNGRHYQGRLRLRRCEGCLQACSRPSMGAQRRRSGWLACRGNGTRALCLPSWVQRHRQAGSSQGRLRQHRCLLQLWGAPLHVAGQTLPAGLLSLEERWLC